MAERRMFAKTIVTSDAFLDMPPTARCLYFLLSMIADDDGFVNAPRSVMRQSGATEDDMKLLIAKRFVLTFESGVIVIKHWKIHNLIQKDRYKETKYIEEKNRLVLDENNAYTELENALDTKCIQDVSKVETQVRLGKDSVDKDSINTISSAQPSKQTKHKYGEYKNVLLTDTEYGRLKERFPDVDARIKKLDEGIELKGYKYKSHYLAIIKWAEKDKPSPIPEEKDGIEALLGV